MKLKLFQIDAFTDRVFGGNPAAVCPLDAWLDDAVLQAIADENNLSETAFFVPTERGFRLRWFTPVAEVDLCGHATLGAAYVLFEILGYAGEAITFETRSGDLIVSKSDGGLQMDFPSQPPKICSPSTALLQGLGKEPAEVLAAGDYVVVYKTEREVRALAPDFAKLRELNLRGVIVTAPGDDSDFVSRFFAPRFGIDEDPVTGSAHCELTPYWAEKLDRNVLRARQVSKRGGELLCELRGDRVLISGRAAKYLEGEITFGD